MAANPQTILRPTRRQDALRAVAETGREHDLSARPLPPSLDHLEPELPGCIDHDVTGSVGVVVWPGALGAAASGADVPLQETKKLRNQFLKIQEYVLSTVRTPHLL